MLIMQSVLKRININNNQLKMSYKVKTMLKISVSYSKSYLNLYTYIKFDWKKIK